MNQSSNSDSVHFQKDNLKEKKLAFTISVLGIILGSIGFLILIKIVFADQNFYLDHAAAAYVSDSISPNKTNFYHNITFLGSQPFLVPAYILLLMIFLSLQKLRKYSWRIFLTVVVGTAVMFGFKYLFGRDRPLEPLLQPAEGHSFPSGHSFSSMLFFSILLFICLRLFRSVPLKYAAVIICLGCSILVGISRIYLGVHFLTDVLAGFSLAIVWVFVCELVLFQQLYKLFSTGRN